MHNKLLRSSIVLSITVCFMFFLYAPLELYFTNKDEFWYDIYVIAPVMFCVFLVSSAVFILGFALLIKGNEKLCRVGLLFLFIVFICSYIQGNYLIRYLPVMDGREIDWSKYTIGRIQSVLLWIIVIAIVTILVRALRMDRMYGLICVVSVCVLLMFVVTLSTLCITNGGWKSKTSICVTTDQEWTMSDKHNFIILLWDMLDGGAFSDIVIGDQEKEQIFKDFTLYDDTMSGYRYTEYNVPFILSGRQFDNRTTREEYFKDTVTTAALFNELENRNYTLGLYETDLRLDESTADRFINVGKYTRRVSSYSAFIRWQIMLVGMKYAPFDLKRFSVVDPTAFERLRIVKDGKEPFQISNNMNFYQALMEKEIAHTADNSFKFIHMWGAHAPYEYDAQMNYLPSGGTYVQSVEMCIMLSDLYLRKLKENGVYDDSVIIIMADHGNGEYYEENNLNQHPVLLIKGVDEHHELQVNDRPVSFADLQSAYLHLLNGGGSASAFDAVPIPDSRRFLWYDSKDDAHMVEYEQTGKVGDMSTMRATGREFNAQ